MSGSVRAPGAPNLRRLTESALQQTLKQCVPNRCQKKATLNRTMARVRGGCSLQLWADKGETLFQVFAAVVDALLERVIAWDGKEWDA